METINKEKTNGNQN